MLHRRIYRTFTYREAVLRICCEQFDVVASEIVRQRHLLENYLRRHPEFHRSLEPVEARADAPQIAQQMAQAARRVGVGPMAAVAGAMAQFAAEAALAAGAEEVIVDNGGDIYASLKQESGSPDLTPPTSHCRAVEPVVIALGTGTAKLADRLAFRVQPEQTPTAICSSSGKMGHSMSLGRCDLATVMAKDAALADAAATLAANLVCIVSDVDGVLERIASIEGITGVLIVQDDRIGLAGRLPRLVKAG